MPRYYNWTTAGPLLLAMQAFQKPLPKVRLNMKVGQSGSYDILLFIKLHHSLRLRKWVVLQTHLHICYIYSHITVHCYICSLKTIKFGL